MASAAAQQGNEAGAADIGGADADETAAAAAEPAPATYDEEVIVIGRSRAILRRQIELAEEAVYARFNEINTDDDYDIHCRLEVYTGSRIPRRVCLPNLWREALRKAGEETTRALQGSSAFSAAQFQAEGLYKARLMAEELERLAREDEALRDAVVHLANLTGAVDERNVPRTVPATAASRVVSADEEGLPYGAAIQASVWIRRDPWTHDLTHRAFAIANVFGVIETIDLGCKDQSIRIDFEPGAEWSVPDGWEACIVTVAAEPGTTFALYEFE